MSSLDLSAERVLRDILLDEGILVKNDDPVAFAGGDFAVNKLDWSMIPKASYAYKLAVKMGGTVLKAKYRGVRSLALMPLPNGAVEYAQSLADFVGCEMLDALEKQPTAEDPRALALRETVVIPPFRNVVLVDDVFTRGSTIKRALSVLPKSSVLGALTIWDRSAIGPDIERDSAKFFQHPAALGHFSISTLIHEYVPLDGEVHFL